VQAPDKHHASTGQTLHQTGKCITQGRINDKNDVFDDAINENGYQRKYTKTTSTVSHEDSKYKGL
jgi:hypothetical protein